MSKPWYEAAFGADYLERYRHRDLGEAARAVEALLADVLPSRGGARVLDLCCGAGRHVVALARGGNRVVGLDLSAELLAAGVEMARENVPDGQWVFVRGDKRRLPFANAGFDVVTHFFTAFGYFESDSENFGVFAEVARVLKPGGWYLFDFLSACKVHEEVNGSLPIKEVEEFPDGVRVETSKCLSLDGRRIEKAVCFFHGATKRAAFRESVRLFEPCELRAGLSGAGFSVLCEWGNYDAEPYCEGESERWIALCRRNP